MQNLYLYFIAFLLLNLTRWNDMIYSIKKPPKCLQSLRYERQAGFILSRCLFIILTGKTS